MILYFSGTGNSYYIASQLAKYLGEKIISIGDLVSQGKYVLKLNENESIGFVYPVHASAPSDIVTNFIKKVKFENYKNNYMYSVYNCAGDAGYTSKIIKKTCEKRGFSIGGFYDVLMPGNMVIFSKHLPEEKVNKYLEEVDDKISDIVKNIKEKNYNYENKKHSFIKSYIVHKLLHLMKKQNFIFGEDCILCGKCSKICPTKAIKLEPNKIVRNEDKCAFCLACVNVCPKEALQIGNMTEGNQRYVHSEYMKSLEVNYEKENNIY